MFSYKKFVIAAAKIVIFNRYLWFFGFFTALFANSGVFQRIYTNDSAGLLQNWQRLQSTGIFAFDSIRAIGALAQADPVGIALRLMILLAVFILAVFIFWLAVVSQGALIRGVSAIYANKKINFNTALQSGRKTFWPVFFFRALEKALMVSLLFAAGNFGVSALANGADMLPRLGYLALFLAALAAVFAVMLVTRYAMSAAVIEDKRWLESLSRGVDILRRNVLVSIEAGAVIFITNVGLGLVALMALAAAAMPFILLLFAFYALAFAGGVQFILVAGTVVLFGFVAVAGAVLAAFGDALWTIFFVHVSKEKLRNHVSNLLAILLGK